ncbi:MAG: two-component regulator propeller domain-containing protein, partial [Saprospiraceae bacterium]
SNAIFSLYQSRDGIIWIGTYKGGVNVFDPKKFKFQTLDNNLRPEHLSYKVVLSIFEDIKRRIWFGTDGGGLNRFDPINGQFDHFVHQPNNANSLSGNAIKSIYEDAQGNLWAGTYGNGLNYLPSGSSQWIRFQHHPNNNNSLSHNHAWDIAEDPDGHLWIATLGGGVNVFDRVHHTFKRYNVNNTQGKLLSNQVFTLLPDGKRHRLWVGTARGLCYFDLQKEQFFPAFPDSTHLDYEVKVLHQDKLGRIWFGTKKNGIYCYDPEKEALVSYRVENGLISNTIAAILEDEQHFLWISTNRGISRLDPSTGTFYNYTTNDGLRNTEYLSESAFKLRNGNLLFGGSEGFDVINSTQIPSNEHLPNVVLTKLWVLNQEIRPGNDQSALAEDITVAKHIRLRHFENVISFEFAALNFTNPEKNQYAYWLENFDQTWNYIGDRRLITFTNLNPGTYTLHVKAANNEGRWNEQGTSLQIHILPPWWQTWWFRILVVLILAGSIFGGFTYRIHTIKKHKRELQRLVHQRTEELAQEKEKVEQQNKTLLQIQGDILLQNEEIRKQRDDIQAMSEKIHRADQEKLDFFTNISHEIRTPLTLIISPLEKALHALAADDPLRRPLSTVYRNAQKLVLLVNQMLDLRKIENKGFVLRAAPQDLVYILQQILSAFAERAAQQNIALHFTSEVPKLEVWLDYEKLDKIISNLLANALKFTPVNGEISIYIKIVEKEHKGQNAQITVSDTGIGIPAAQLDQIFDAFYQADNAHQLQSGGTGIGLAIAKSLTELHHGTIQVQSEVGKGTQFQIQLPLGNTHLSEAEMVSNLDAVVIAPSPVLITNTMDTTTAYHTPTTNDQRPTILIVEDNADLRAYLRECLETFYQIHEAANGREGIAKALKIMPNLILSDIMMSEMDGLELCKNIKTRLETSHIPIILLTAKSAQEHKLEGLEIGADDYLAKPFDIREVQIRIANLIQNRQLLRKKFSQNITLDPQEITLTSTDAQFLQKALTIVEQYLSDPDFSVTHFVQHMGVSRSLLHLKLKELSDQSASDFIRSIRLKRAAQLLVQNQLTVAEVAYTVGFNDPKYFHKCFKEKYGVTPGNFAANLFPIDVK